MDTRLFFVLWFVFLQTYSVECLTENSLSQMKMYQAMSSQRIGAVKFASWVDQANLATTFNGEAKLTVFVWNDTAYNTMPAEDRNVLNMISGQADLRNYIDTFTIQSEKNVDAWVDGSIEKPLNGRRLFIDKKRRTFVGVGGTSGTIGTYVNGAMIDTSFITQNGIIHRLVSPLLPVSNKNVYEWINQPELNIQTPNFQALIQRLQQENVYYYDTVPPLANSERITMFIPSDQAIARIPATKRESLSGKVLSTYMKMHYIPNDVVFTSYLEHQNSFATADPGTRAIFMVQDDRVLVRSGGVTAQVIRGNITVTNGVIHIIDRMLGYVYFTAREQINADCQEGLTCQFKQLIDGASPNIASLISKSGINMFVPTDEAFQRLQMYRNINMQMNISLSDFVLRLCIIKDSAIEVSRINGNFDVRQRRTSEYNQWQLVIFNDRNDTWVNGGNVRARVVRPDVDTTNNGRLQYIDGVPGVPWMDLSTTIEYDEHLLYTWNDIKRVGLNNYLRDPTFNPNKNALPPKPFIDNSNGQNLFTTTYSPYGGNQNQYPTQYPNQNQNPYGNQNQYPTQYPNQNQNQYPNQNPNNNYGQMPTDTYRTCGDIYNVCRMTFFVPNGTATYHYALTNFGFTIRSQTDRYRFIMRRLIVHQEIYLERMMPNRQYSYNTDSGETIVLKKETENIARLYWGGNTARVLMWDIGASNGVVHIIDNFLSDNSDLDRDISHANTTAASCGLFGLIALLWVYLFSWRQL